MDKEQIGMCGAYCGVCDWKDKTNCPGCQTRKGDMFWGQCAVAKCCLAKGISHCGPCPATPPGDLSRIILLPPCAYHDVAVSWPHAGAGYLAFAQQRALQVPELVEAEQRVVARAPEATVAG